MTRTYGQIAGITDRFANWVQRVKTDKSLPWVGLGLIDDMEVLLRLLSLEEFGQWLHGHSDDELQQWGVEVLAAADAQAELDTLPTLEALAETDRAAGEYEKVRTALIQTGALSPGDTETDIPALIRALLS